MFDKNNLQVLSDVNPQDLENAINKIKPDNGLKGLSKYFSTYEDVYNVNAIIMTAIACLESTYGTSKLAKEKCNLFGLDAKDSLVGTDKYGSGYKTKADSIKHAFHRIGKQYIELDPSCKWRYVGSKDIYNVGKKWCSKSDWADKVVSVATRITDNINKKGVVDMKKVYIDAGHGGNDSGAVGINNAFEKNITLSVAKKVEVLLKKQNIEVRMSRSSDITRSLSFRSQDANAWKANCFISIHCNSAASMASGLETFCYKFKYRQLADNIHNQLLADKLYTKNRGVKEGNHHVTRETNMSACLIELGFINHPDDLKLMLNKQDEFAISIAKGICKHLGVKYVDNKPQVTEGVNTVYYIRTGGFGSKEVAKQKLDYLKGLTNWHLELEEFKPGTGDYCIKTGGFTGREKVERKMNALKELTGWWMEYKAN
ncbi:sporulation-specific N-acetylmuramoyl-L-alanine amidase CwlC [[Clostridium] sordellii]|uniref:N-acetylmuramoyl-L-alanine amidase n=1 Tax=Paraclostridium sordellii TaxID=1505 RepID=UPI0005E5678B|nr:N-acetylmuramoyl-L-alanine amidase [Paeniclostridium sordellii]CEQ01745.1 sporulation-specific N-acetylmuramoyl-L-alanine amidase CwlC [[Clostridium] sordellii] [Paeniclostridium sordellii]